MKGTGPASVTSGSPPVPPPSTSSPAPLTTTSTPATTPPATAAPSSLFGAPAKPSATFSFGGPAPTVPTSTSLFGAPAAKPASTSLFGAPASTATPPSSTPPPATAPPSMLSGFKPAIVAAAPSKTPAASVFAAPAAPSAPQAPLSNVEAEFNKLLEQMATEFNKLRQDTVTLRERHAQKARAGVPSPTIQSTSDASKWGLGDLTGLKQVTNLVAKEVDQLQGLSKDFISQMAELQPGAEKVHAKKNEIARYIKAKKDPKYTRLLKSRTSSPEHVESQTKLRKSIQIVRERTRQLEDFMATQKSRMQKQKEGKREFKVPSLDTINRTMRNIDTALAQKSDEIARLTARVDRLKLKAPRRKVSTNGTIPLALPPAETEKIKLASAAALNMERTSVRLKSALLQVRAETPLNTSAVGAPVEPKPTALAKILPPPTPKPTAAPAATPPVSFTPKVPLFAAPPPSKPPATPGSFVPISKPAAPTTSSFVLPAAPVAIPAFSPLGKDEFHVTAAYEHSSRRTEKSRMHGSSAKLKTPSPNISRTSADAPAATPLPPLIPPAKSFFGVSTPVAVQPARNPVPFSFASPPPPPASGVSGASTPKLPPIPNWGSSSFTSSIGSVNSSFVSSVGSVMGNGSNKVKEDGEEEEEGEGDEDDDEDDEDWAPGDEDEDEDEDEDDEGASDDAEEGVEDDDPTV
ncbi:hypothetical protein FRC08_018804 [Ceratobasidium sp. 394]|nr:hypothetical protein FRC08_018804 [Ceratobasidium sp. 394]